MIIFSKSLCTCSICFFDFLFKENESFAQGAPETSTPNVVDVAKKTAAKAVASKANKAPGKAMEPSSTQNVGRIMTRRASKM